MPWLDGRRRRREHWNSEEDYRKDPFNSSHTYNAQRDLNHLRERYNLPSQPMRPRHDLTMLDLELVELGYWLSIEPTDPVPESSLWISVPDWADVALNMYYDFLRDAELPYLPLFARWYHPSTNESGQPIGRQTDTATVREWHLDALKDALGSRREVMYDDPNDPYNASSELDEAYRALGDVLDAEGAAVAPARHRLAEILKRPEHGGEQRDTSADCRTDKSPPKPMGRGTPPRPALIHRGSLPVRLASPPLPINQGRTRSETAAHQGPLLFDGMQGNQDSAQLPAPYITLGSNDAPRATTPPASGWRSTQPTPSRPSKRLRNGHQCQRQPRNPLDAHPAADTLRPPPDSDLASYSNEQLDHYKAQLAAEAAALGSEDDDDFDDADIGEEDHVAQSVEKKWTDAESGACRDNRHSRDGQIQPRSTSVVVGGANIMDPHCRRASARTADDLDYMTEDEQIQHAIRLSMESASHASHWSSIPGSEPSSNALPHLSQALTTSNSTPTNAWDRFNSPNALEMTDEQQLDLALKISAHKASQDPDELDDEQQMELALRMSVEEASHDAPRSKPRPPQPRTPSLQPRQLPPPIQSSAEDPQQASDRESLPPRPSTPTMQSCKISPSPLSIEEASPDDSLAEPFHLQPSTPKPQPRQLSPPPPLPGAERSATEEVNITPMRPWKYIHVMSRGSPRPAHQPQKQKRRFKRSKKALSVSPAKSTGSRKKFSDVARIVLVNEERSSLLRIHRERSNTPSRAPSESKIPLTEHDPGFSAQRGTTPAGRLGDEDVQAAIEPGSPTPGRHRSLQERVDGTTARAGPDSSADELQDLNGHVPSPRTNRLRRRRKRRLTQTTDSDWGDEQPDPPMTEEEWRRRITVIQQLRELTALHSRDRWLTDSEQRLHENYRHVPMQSSYYHDQPAAQVTPSNPTHQLRQVDSLDGVHDAAARRRSDRIAQGQDPVALVQAAMSRSLTSDALEVEVMDAAPDIWRILTSRETIRERARAVLRGDAQSVVQTEPQAGDQQQPRLTELQEYGGRPRNEPASSRHHSNDTLTASVEQAPRTQRQAHTLDCSKNVSQTVGNAPNAASGAMVEQQGMEPRQQPTSTSGQPATIPPDIPADMEPLYRIFQEAPGSDLTWHEYMTGVQEMACNDSQRANNATEEDKEGSVRNP